LAVAIDTPVDNLSIRHLWRNSNAYCAVCSRLGRNEL